MVYLTKLLAGLTALLLLASVLIIAVYYFYSRHRTKDAFGQADLQLRYFIQPQVNHTGDVIGYECLLREQQADGAWRLPQNLDALPLQRVIPLLHDTFATIPTAAESMAINLTYEQIVSHDFNFFARWAISQVHPLRLNIEMSITDQQHYHHHRRFLAHVQNARRQGLGFVVDNVGADNATLKQMRWMVPAVDSIKCAVKYFRKSDGKWLDLNLQFWHEFASKYGIDLILMGIENDQDISLATQLEIDMRQGFMFGRPVDPAVAAHGGNNGTKSSATPLQ